MKMTEEESRTLISMARDGRTLEVETPPISADTIARTVVFALAWANQLFAFIGLPTLEFEQEGAYMAISTAITLGASAWAAWKDNAFTIAARVGNLVTKALKEGEVAAIARDGE